MFNGGTDKEKKGFMEKLLGLFKKKTAAVSSFGQTAPVTLTSKTAASPVPESTHEKEALAEQKKFYDSLLASTTDKKAPRVSDQPHTLPVPPLPPVGSEKSGAPRIETMSADIELAKAAADNVAPGEEIKAKEIAVQSSKPLTPVKSSTPSTTDVIPPTSFDGKKVGLLDRLLSKNVRHKLVKEKEKELAWQERTQVEKRFWQPANAIKPNLIKNQEVVFFNWHENFLVLGLSLMMCCLAIGLLYVGLLIWQKERLDTTQVALQNTKVIDQQINLGEQEAVEIKTFTQKLNTVSALLDNHVYWTNFFKFLEDNTLKDVYFANFTGDLSGEYSIPGHARSLDAITLQFEVMKVYPKIKSLTPDTGDDAADGKSINFNLGMSIDPTIFIK